MTVIVSHDSEEGEHSAFVFWTKNTVRCNVLFVTGAVTAGRATDCRSDLDNEEGCSSVEGSPEFVVRV